MSDKNNSNSGWSLQDEIKKRKTQEIDREILKRKTSTVYPTPPAIPPAKPTENAQTPLRPLESLPSKRGTGMLPPIPEKRSTGIMPLVSADGAKRSTQSLPPIPEPQKRSTGIMPLTSADGVKRSTQSMPPIPDAPKRATGILPLVSADATKRSTGMMSSVGDVPRRATQSIPAASDTPKRATQSMPTVQAGESVKRITQTVGALSGSVENMRPQQKKTLIAALVAVVALIGVMGTAMLADANHNTTQSPTYKATDGTIMTAQPTIVLKSDYVPDDVLAYLNKVGVTTSNKTSLVVNASKWHASQETGFVASAGGNSSQFYVLSYSGDGQQFLGFDFNFLSAHGFADWKNFSVSNIGIIAEPNTSPDLWRAICSHLTSMIIASHTSLMAAPTKTPTATPIGGVPTATPTSTP